MPWWAAAWRYREEMADAPCPPGFVGHCIGSTVRWLDKLLERLPGGALFPPMPPIVCDCEQCREAE